MAILRPILETCGYAGVTGHRLYHPDAMQVAFDDLPLEEREAFREALRRFGEANALHSGTTPWQPEWSLSKPRSTVLVALIGGSGLRVFVKRSHAENNGSNALSSGLAMRESFARRARLAAVAVEGCRTLPLLAAYTDLRIEIAPYVEGVSLQDLILTAASAWGNGARRTLGLIGAAARWLAAFQEAVGRTGGSLSPSVFSKPYLSCWAALQERYAKLLKDLPLERVLAWVEYEFRCLPPSDRDASLCHGDFGPFNMLVAPKRGITVIDFGSASIGSRLTDACYFLHQLWKMRFNPMLSRQFAARARETFIEQYGRQKRTSPGLIRLEEAFRCVCTLAYLVGERSPRYAVLALHDRWVAAECVRRLRQLVFGSRRDDARATACEDNA